MFFVEFVSQVIASNFCIENVQHTPTLEKRYSLRRLTMKRVGHRIEHRNGGREFARVRGHTVFTARQHSVNSLLCRARTDRGNSRSFSVP